ncbi:MAG: DUF6252 family protein [Saprospiraceae bacterium]
MKTIRLLLFLLPFLIISCGKDDDNNNNDNNNTDEPTEPFFSMKIDGADWVPENFYYKEISGTGVPLLYASNTIYTLSLDFDGTPATGSYDLSSQSKVITNFYKYLSPGYSEYSIESGELKITIYDADNDIFKGSFSFVAKNNDDNSSITITDGGFFIDGFN